MLLPTGKIATVLFTPLNNEGNPAQLDGVASFALAPGSEVFVELLPSENDNEFRLKALAVGEAEVIVTGDARLGDGVEPFEHYCPVTVYNEAVGGVCSITALDPIVDE